MLVSLFFYLVTLIGSQYYSYSLVVIGQVIAGMSGFPLVIQSFIYVCEIAEDGLRQRASVAINYAW